MDYFLTTYRKDFKWPVAKASPQQKQLDNVREMKELGINDAEPCLKDQTKVPFVKTNEAMQEQTAIQQAGVASKYLLKLFKKYPYLNNVMKFTNPDEMAKRILSEKYKTTYQIEYNKDEFHPANNFTQIMDVLDTVEKTNAKEKPEVSACAPEGKTPIICKCAQGLSYVPCRCAKDAPVRRVAWKPAPISKIPQAPREKRKKKKEEEERAEKAAATGNQKKLKPFQSEYNDTIGKVGGIIIRKKLLYPDTEQDHENEKELKEKPKQK